MAADEVPGTGIGDIRTDVRQNMVIVGLYPAGEIVLAQQLQTRFGSLLAIKAADQMSNQVCSSRTSCTPYRAGIQIYHGTGICTSGFIVKKNGTSNYYMLTAGHCGPTGYAWFHDEVQVGVASFRAYANLGNADAELISRAGTTGHKNWIYVLSTEMARTVDTVEGHDADTVGDSVCQSGVTTGFWCGTIVNVDLDGIPDDNGIITNNLREATYASNPGDSGGPLFYGHVAKGVLKGGLSNGHGVYTHIWEACNALACTVLTAPV
jgi:streptogrisin C